jgi:hypothetical protein
MVWTSRDGAGAVEAEHLLLALSDHDAYGARCRLPGST